MIPKVINSTSFDYGDPAVSLVRFHRLGVDDLSLRKIAATTGVFHDFLKNFVPPKNQTVIHVLAVGDDERYGPNRNCDGFSAEDNAKAHPSFKKIGHVFKNHKNTDPKLAVGDVLETAHNPEMSRIELILGLDNNKCASAVDALEKGEDPAVSMGSMQDYDVCSLCGHKAPTARQHCMHIQSKLGMVTDDGQKIYMQNPNPKFFDISLVHKPADRIAYSLRKVAAENEIIGGHELAADLGWDTMDLEKVAMKRTLASLAKQIPLAMKGVVSPERLEAQTTAELKKTAAAYGIAQVLGYLSNRDCLLHPQDFGDLIGMQDTSLCKAAVDSHDGLQAIMDDHTNIGGFDAPAYQERIPLSAHAEGDLQVKCGMSALPVTQRVVASGLFPLEKTAAVQGPEHQGFSALYACYKLAWAQQHGDRLGFLKTLAATF